MNVLDRIRDGFKYLDKNGLKHLIEKIMAHDVHWTGTHAEYEAVKDTIPAYAILHFTDDYDAGAGVHPDWEQALSITMAQLTAGYTAPDNGMICGSYYTSLSSGSASDSFISVNGVQVGCTWSSNNSFSMWSGPVIVNKGDVIKVSSAYGVVYQIYQSLSFVPWKI